MRLIVTRLVRDEGTVVVFEGREVTDLARGKEYVSSRPTHFAADHRPAQDIASALEAGEAVEVEVELWQVLGGPR